MTDNEYLNVQMGLARETSEAERERIIANQRAGQWGSQGGGYWSPPGGLSLLWGFLRKAAGNTESRRKPASSSSRVKMALVLAFVAAAYCKYANHPVEAGAIFGGLLGLFLREILVLACIGVILAGIYQASNSPKTSDQSSEPSAAVSELSE